MISVLDEEEILINNFRKTDIVKNIIRLKSIINKENLIKNSESIDNEIVKEYIKNINELDLYIYYINSGIKRLINNKSCRSNNENN